MTFSFMQTDHPSHSLASEAVDDLDCVIHSGDFFEDKQDREVMKIILTSWLKSLEVRGEE